MYALLTACRDAFREMLESVSGNGHSYDFCKEELKKSTPRSSLASHIHIGAYRCASDIKLDAGFKDFHAYCKAHDIPVVIISSGMEPTIRAVLANLVGDAAAAEIDVVSNDVDLHADGTWSIKYRHPSSGFGHDKSQAILPYRRLASPPLIFFFGDGVSGERFSLCGFVLVPLYPNIKRCRIRRAFPLTPSFLRPWKPQSADANKPHPQTCPPRATPTCSS